MLKKDLRTAFTISLLISLALLPTLYTTNVYNRLPFPIWSIFIIFPLLVLLGIYIATLLAKTFPVVLQFAKFALVGLSNTSVDFGLLNLLLFLTNTTGGINVIPINAISFSVAILNSYFWNKRWVFKEGKNGNFIIFLVITIFSLIINTGIVYLITNFVEPIGNLSSTLWINLAKVLATGISLCLNFFGYKLIVFNK